MENHTNTFNLNSGEPSQFRIEVADGAQGRFFNIRPLADQLYEISDDEGVVGSIQLDREDHQHCGNLNCNLDIPLLHSIRSQIQFHLEWNPRN